MLLDDDIVYMDDLKDVTKPSRCRVVPLKKTIVFKDLWLPSRLLPNRKKAKDSDMKGPSIYHTLNKPDVESFSVYTEDEDSDDYTENVNLRAFESRKSKTNLTKESKPTYDTDSPKHLQEFELRKSSETNLNKASNPTYAIDSPKHCFSDKVENSEQYSLHFSDEEEIDKQGFAKPSFSDRSKNSEDVLNLFLELLNEKSTLPESETECHNEEKSVNIEDKQKQNKGVIKQYEQVPSTLNSESPITIENETNYEEKSEIFLHTLNSKCSLCKDKYLDSVCYDKGNSLNAVNVERPYLEDNVKKQTLCLDTLSSNMPLREAKIQCHDMEKNKNFLDVDAEPLNLGENGKQNLCLDSETPLCKDKIECHNEEDPDNSIDMVSLGEMGENSLTGSSPPVVTELPIAYKKLPVQDAPVPPKNLKPKKKKNAAKKSKQLEGFFQPPISGGSTDNHEFYDNLVRRGLCSPRNPCSSTNFPEAEALPQKLSFEEVFPEEKSSHPSMSLFTYFPEEEAPPRLSFEEVPEEISSLPAMPHFPEESNVIKSNENVQSSEGELEGETITTFILENIGCQISIESIEELMLCYGNIKDLSFERDGEYFKAIVKLVLNSEEEVNWLVECLNGSEAFGTSSAKLKCTISI